MKKKLFVWLLILVLSTSMVGCGSTQTSDSASPGKTEVAIKYNDVVSKDAEQADNYELNSAAANPASKETEVAASGGADISATNVKGISDNVNVNQKIIFTGQVNYETLDFEKTRTALCEYITSIGGFTQNSSVQGGRIGYGGLKSAVYVFRIPKAKYSQSFIDMREFGTIVLEQSNGEDVTDQYFDTEARLKSLKIQQERLQALLQKAVKMEDILKIEKELQTTLYEIEKYTGTIKKWDSLVEYSTLTVNVNEVQQIKPVTPKEKDGFFTRIAFGFKNSVIGLGEFLQNFIIFIASALPVVIPLGLIGFLVYRVVRKKIKKAKVDE